MAEYLIKDTTLTAIGDEVRSMSGETSQLSPAEMATELEGVNVEISEQEDLIEQIEAALLDKAGGGIDTSDDTVTEETLVVGYTAHNAEGVQITGINPYELESTNMTVENQANLIAQALELIQGKAAYNTIHIGTSEPTADIGVNGDIYIVRSET